MNLVDQNYCSSMLPLITSESTLQWILIPGVSWKSLISTLMCTSNPVRSVRGFLPIIPSKFINVHRLPCWSSHLSGQGILILTIIHQHATALSPLIKIVSLSLPPVLQWIWYFSYLSMLHLLCWRPHTWVWNPYLPQSLDMSKQVFLPVLWQIWLQSTIHHWDVLLYLFPNIQSYWPIM